MKLSEYDCEIQHVARKQNVLADSSRRPDYMEGKPKNLKRKYEDDKSYKPRSNILSNIAGVRKRYRSRDKDGSGRVI